MRCAPRSVATRYTVCAIQRPECQIQLFEEVTGRSQIPTVATYSYSIDAQNPVILLDFVPLVPNRGEPESIPDIIIVHRDGTVRRISGDLKEIRWICASVQKSDQRTLLPDVVSAHWISYAEASTALLRRRDDILRECAASASSFLVLIHRDGDHEESGLRAGVFEVPANHRNGLTFASATSWLRLMISNPIPSFERWSSAPDVQISFHASSARLSISSTNALINYDLSAYIPEVVSKFPFTEGHSSMFPLTASLAAGALRTAVQIYDMKYQSIQRRYELSTKRRSRGPEAGKAVRFISYFAKLDVLVAIRGRSLISFEIGRTRPNHGNASRPQGLLIDALGHNTYGAGKVTVPAEAELRPGFSEAIFVPNSLEQAGWEAEQKILDDLVQKDKVDEFERRMAGELQRSVAAEASASLKDPSVALPMDGQFVKQAHIRYLLSKIFDASPIPSTVGEAKEEISLVIAFFPPNLFRWLARHDHLGSFEIERALSTQASHVRMQPGAVARSIIGQEPSLGLLAVYLQNANIVGLDESLMVIKFLIINAVARARRASPFEGLLKEPRQMAVDDFIPKQTEDPASERQFGATATGWSAGCVTAMNETLMKLDGFSQSRVTSAMCEHLSTEETLTLIQFLRQQLFRSGCTSSFPSSSGTSEDLVLPLELTASVLSSCMDALGPLSFLRSASDRDIWDGLIPDLRSEISLALGSLEEATYLKGVLQEMVRYGNVAMSTEDSPTEPSTQIRGETGPKAGMIVKVYAEPAEEHGRDLQEPSALLPLSLKAENVVSRSKKRKGGGEILQRSGRELQYLQSRNAGRYSFERLIL